MRQRQVHIVAAEDQVVAHAAARQSRFALLIEVDIDQAEVGSAAAHVHHQDAARVCQLRVQVVAVAVQKIIKSGLRFFHQPERGQAGQLRRCQREGAGAFVERGGNGQHQFLAFQRGAGKARIPGRAHMGQVAGAGGHRRNPGHVALSAPGQDGCMAVDIGMRQPALGARYQPARYLAAQHAREYPGDGVLHAGHVRL